MNRKQALIVDDSKTAQYLLKRMLQKYDLTIDAASSAEEALAYLSYNHPAVIFLDHQMTGMTGMEALKTIKANPHTALIPVIMYTSQNDDLFVGQAVALGAQGILSKSALHPANLQQVLARLNIHASVVGDEVESEAQTAAMRSTDEVGTSAATPQQQPSMHVTAHATGKPAAADLDQVRLQIGRLFEIHIADVRSQISTSAQFIIKRLSTTIDKAAQREAGTGNHSLAHLKSMVAGAIAAERRKRTLANRLLLAAVLAALAVCGYWLSQIQSDAQTSSQKILAALEAQKADKPLLVATLAGSMANDRAAVAVQPIHPALLQAISWAQNADFHFDYGEPPLSGMRLSNLHQLVYLLAEGGYRGPLIVNLNFGNFCLEPDAAGMLRPAGDHVRASACKMQKDSNPRFSVNDYVTLQYQAFLNNAAPLRDGRISIRLVTNGMSTPRVEYPALTPQTSAADWNRAALRNNRISVQFPN